jgi:antitoxin component of MazEF toxin-antitoxin module
MPNATLTNDGTLRLPAQVVRQLRALSRSNKVSVLVADNRALIVTPTQPIAQTPHAPTMDAGRRHSEADTDLFFERISERAEKIRKRTGPIHLADEELERAIDASWGERSKRR